MQFVAIDVETANADMSSICQVGIATFTDNGAVEGWECLINPQDYFDPMNIHVHGIRPGDVANAPTLPDVIADIRLLLEGRVVVCHTHFDRVSLRQACEKYGLSVPDCLWLDTAQVARRTWDQFARSGYGLQNVCTHIGYEYQAHDALEDAKAAGMVLRAAIARSGLSVDDWIQRVRRPIDASAAGSQSVFREGGTDGELAGEVMVFTGALRMARRQAADLAAAAGCRVEDSLTKRTTLLVVGDQDVAKLAGHDKSSKHRKAEALIQQGHAIRILRETDFLAVVGSEAIDLPATQATESGSSSVSDEDSPVHAHMTRRGLVIEVEFAIPEVVGGNSGLGEFEDELYFGEGLDQDLGEANELACRGRMAAAERRLKQAEAKYGDPWSRHRISEEFSRLWHTNARTDAEALSRFLDRVELHLVLLTEHSAVIAEREREIQLAAAAYAPEPYRAQRITELTTQPYRLRIWTIKEAAIICEKQSDFDRALAISMRAARADLDDGTKGGFAGRVARLEKKRVATWGQ